MVLLRLFSKGAERLLHAAFEVEIRSACYITAPAYGIQYLLALDGEGADV